MSEAPKTSPLHRQQDAGPVLSVFSPADTRRRSEQLSPQMTLRQFYDAYLLPVCRRSKGNDPKTITIDRTALGYWEHYTRDPSLEEVDEFDMGDFTEGHATLVTVNGRPRYPEDLTPEELERAKPISANTIRKHCTHLQFIIDRAGPRSRRVRNAARLIAEPPGFERPPACERSDPEVIPLEEIGRWMSACRYADRPKMCRIKPATFWRALVLFTYNTGLRIDTTMQLTWSMFDTAGWLDVPARIFKGKRHGGKFYVNSAAGEAIEPLRRHGYERIFPWYTWPGGRSNLHKTRRELWRIAGIRRPGNGFHGLRKSLLTWLAGHNDLIARFVAGHVAGNDVLATHYVDHRLIVHDLLEQVPQPIWSDHGEPTQMTLPGFALCS